jgi:hypothetical protein
MMSKPENKARTYTPRDFPCRADTCTCLCVREGPVILL